MNQHGVVTTVRTRERLVGMAAQAPATSALPLDLYLPEFENQ